VVGIGLHVVGRGLHGVGRGLQVVGRALTEYCRGCWSTLVLLLCHQEGDQVGIQSIVGTNAKLLNQVISRSSELS